MTLNRHKYNTRFQKHQIVLIDDKGRLFESCDSIFDSSEYIGLPLEDHFYFFESELVNFQKSAATKTKFEKVKVNFKSLPGYYDFVLSKIDVNGQNCVLWEIFDYTTIYNEYLIIQQLRNEISIIEQYVSKYQSSKKQDDDNFFQSNFSSTKNIKLSDLKKELEESKFDLFSSISVWIDKAYIEKGITELKECMSGLIDEINFFVQQLKASNYEEVNISDYVSSLIAKNNNDQTATIYSTSYAEGIPKKLFLDKKIIEKFIRILMMQGPGQEQLVEKSLRMAYEKSFEGIPFLVFNFKEQVESVSNLTSTSACILIKITILKSLVNMIGGTLKVKIDENEAYITTDLFFPLK